MHECRKDLCWDEVSLVQGCRLGQQKGAGHTGWERLLTAKIKTSPWPPSLLRPGLVEEGSFLVFQFRCPYWRRQNFCVLPVCQGTGVRVMHNYHDQLGAMSGDVAHECFLLRCKLSHVKGVEGSKQVIINVQLHHRHAFSGSKHQLGEYLADSVEHSGSLERSVQRDLLCTYVSM